MQMCILLYYWAYKMMMMIMLMTHRPLLSLIRLFRKQGSRVQMTLRPLLGAVAWESHFKYPPTCVAFFLADLWENVTSSTKLILMPPEEDWATATMIACIEKLVNFENVVDETFKRRDKQTDRHACRNTPPLCRRGIHSVKWRHVICGHDTIAILWL